MSYNEWLDMEVLEDYLDGKLDAKMMHQVEKISLEDPFVAEALAGLSQSPKRSQSLSLLQKQLHERVAQKPQERKRWTITSQRLSIAATAAVLFVTVSLLFYMRESNRRQNLAKQDKNITVAIAPQVAIAKPELPKPPVTKIEAEVDKALANTKTNGYVNNNYKPRGNEYNAIPKAKELKLASPIVVDDVLKNTTTLAKPVATTGNDKSSLDQELVLSKRVAENKTNIQSLNNKPEGLTFTPNVFRGQVLSKYDGLPIPGADVKLVNTDIRTTTNSKGEFSLRSDSLTNQNIAINSLGFTAKEIRAKANQPLKVELETNSNALNEVTIVDFSKTGMLFSPNSSGAQPIKGWADYQLYIKTSKQLPKPKTGSYEVILSFEITKDGTPDHILIEGIKEHVVTAEETKYRNEAVRLLKAGPKWIYNSTPIRRGELKIIF